MKPKLSRQGSVVYVTFENGKCYRLESVLDRRRADLAAAEVREREQIKNLWWRLATRSRDLPRSRASRADLSDNGRAAALIRSSAETEVVHPLFTFTSRLHLPTQPTTNFYNGRMSKAIAFLCRCQRIKYGSPEHRALSTLLWSVFRNRRTFRRDTLSTLHLTRAAYLRHLRTYTAIFTTADWTNRQSESADLRRRHAEES